jgi:hypothetical protein
MASTNHQCKLVLTDLQISFIPILKKVNTYTVQAPPHQLHRTNQSSSPIRREKIHLQTGLGYEERLHDE